MEELLSTQDMAIIDENSNYLGVPTILLMENAGRELSRVVQSKINVKDKVVQIFAGMGNNGGDSFVFARHICGFCKEVYVNLVGYPEKIRSSISKTNWNAIQKMDFSIKTNILRDSSNLKTISIKKSDVIIDGLLGTGVSGKIREPVASAINLINDLNGLKIAVDVPSGMNPDTGEISDVAVKADFTVTFHKIKRGLVKNKDYTGEIIPVGIGIPPEAEFIVGPGDLRAILKKRAPGSHKGEFGKVLVIGGGGGKYYSGAPALSGLAAIRTGADLVNIAAPSSVSHTIRGYSPDLIVRDLPGEYLSGNSMPILEPLLNWASGVIIGPGLGLNSETLETILDILEKVRNMNIPVLVDADAIKAMAQNKTILSGAPAVITPHFGEYKVLTGIDLFKIKETRERLKVIQKSANELKVTILVKGQEDFISNGVYMKVNRTGTPSMTVGGTGDVLSGIVGCLLSQGITPVRAASAGAFINGLAGEYADENRFGAHIMASDLIEFIPKAMHL